MSKHAQSKTAGRLGCRAAALVRDAGGLATIELALVLPIILMILLACFDVASGFAMKLEVEAAAQRTTDLALANRPLTGNSAYLQQEGAAAAGVPAANVAVDIFLECDGVRQTLYVAVCLPGQQSARLVAVVIRKTFRPHFDYQAFASLFGTRLLPSDLVVQGDSVVRIQ